MSMLVVQTAAEPPNQGRRYLLMISCTWNRRNALRKEVKAKRTIVVRAVLGFCVGSTNVALLEVTPALPLECLDHTPAEPQFG
jgi:hypothetical protein